MEEIFEDENLFQAFYSYSRRNLMSEAIDLWKAVESIWQHDNSERERREMYKAMAADFFLRGCRYPVNINHDLLDRLRRAYLNLQYSEDASVSNDLLLDLRRELWLLISSSCLPAFLDSDVYENFQNGVILSSKEEFSIQKAEQFFGYRINPLEIQANPMFDLSEVSKSKKKKRPRSLKRLSSLGSKARTQSSPLSPFSSLSPVSSPLSANSSPASSPPSTSTLSLPPPRSNFKPNAADFSFLTDFPMEVDGDELMG